MEEDPNLTEKERRLKIMSDLCDEFPCVMPFIPSHQIMIKLIHKASTLKKMDDVLTQINPKERKRLVDE